MKSTFTRKLKDTADGLFININSTLLGCILVGTILFTSGCKSEEPAVPIEDLTGKYIDKIERNVIYFEDGSQFPIKDNTYYKSFYLIRHAEKDSVPADNPNLSEAGVARSTRLAEIMRGVNLDALYSTFTSRTLFTVDSISDIKGLPILPYENGNLKQTVIDIRSSLDKHNVLIVGHSNTIPVLANYLADTQYYQKTFDDSDYDNLIIVLDKMDSTKLILPLKYK